MAKYSIKRKMVDTSKWYQLPKRKPMWCLVKTGKYRDIDPHSGYIQDIENYEQVVLYHEDLEVIKEEYNHFTGKTI